MKKIFLLIVLYTSSISLFSQEVENMLVKNLQSIKAQQGDSIARIFLESKKDSLEKMGESSSYILLWGWLTSNMWNTNPTESLKNEYKEYLNAIIDDEIKSQEYTPELELLPYLRLLTCDYYKMLFNDEDWESALTLLKSIHRWFEPYADNRNTVGYAQCLYDLCMTLIEYKHDYITAEPLCNEYLDVAKKIWGDNSAQYAVALFLLSTLPQMSSEAKCLLEQAIEIYGQTDCANNDFHRLIKQRYERLLAVSTGVANTSSINAISDNLLSYDDCTLLIISGHGEAALESLLRYKKDLSRDGKFDIISYANVINLLIQAYMQIGDYSSAQDEIDSFNDSIGINLEVLPAKYVQMFFSHEGIIAYRLKDYPKALRYSQAACKLFEETGDYGMEYSKVLANIAIIYAEAGQYISANYRLDAKWYIDEAISVFEERVGPLIEHGSIGITLLTNKAFVYEEIGDINNAITALKEVVASFSDNEEVKEAWLLAVNNLAATYMKQGRWYEGESLLEDLSSVNDDTNYVIKQNSALCNMYMKENDKALIALSNMNQYAINNIGKIFSYFAGIERDDYWSQIAKELTVVNNLIAYHTKDNKAVSIAYDIVLFNKTLLMNFHKIVDNYLKDTDNIELKNIYVKYKDLKEQYAYKSTNQLEKNNLYKEITNNEKILLTSIENLDLLIKEDKTWKDVKNSLSEGEIAIEFCYAPQMYKYPDLQPYYGAFILRKDFEYPILISLENVDKVETIIESDTIDELYINELYSSGKIMLVYNMIWKKITPFLKDVKTIYYSPTGYLSNINFDILYGDDNILLGEKYTMIRTLSTANIGNIKNSKCSSFNSLILYGNIAYDESIEEMKDASDSYYSFTGVETYSYLKSRSNNDRGNWSPLPSSKNEIYDIGNMASQKGLNVSIFEKNAGNEESVKSLSGKSPDILHFATHGFMIESQKMIRENKFVASTNIYSQKESYMMWAGLMLAGGNNTWQGNFNLDNVEDGILTADEISRLDLSNTKLVVLSACETAKGKIDPIDGIYGLQRAFKMAGVETIIMSLWKVDDEATSILMTNFYKYLIEGKEKHDALWRAMMDVRKEYKDPYYWAGFIMLD